MLRFVLSILMIMNINKYTDWRTFDYGSFDARFRCRLYSAADLFGLSLTPSSVVSNHSFYSYEGVLVDVRTNVSSLSTGLKPFSCHRPNDRSPRSDVQPGQVTC